MIKIANTPYSWEYIVPESDEEEDFEEYPYDQILDEVASLGYDGIELGDYGVLPIEPDILKNELQSRNLDLAGAFLSLDLSKEKMQEGCLKIAMEIAELLYESGNDDAYLVLSDEIEANPNRAKFAGRITPEMSLDFAGWEVLSYSVAYIARIIFDTYGVRTVFHPHAATFIETPDEIKKMMDKTDPGLVGLCLDTGHFRLGGSDPIDALLTYKGRVKHIHLRDFMPEVFAEGQQEGWMYYDFIENGLFDALGQGSLDYILFVEALQKINYQGWLVIEQDLPLIDNATPYDFAKYNREYLKLLGF